MKILKALRTNLSTGETREVEVTYEIKETPSDKVFQLIGGVTGYESFYIDDKTLSKYRDAPESCEGWLACFGTEGRYDRLLVPLQEMRKALGLVKSG